MSTSKWTQYKPAILMILQKEGHLNNVEIAQKILGSDKSLRESEEIDRLRTYISRLRASITEVNDNHNTNDLNEYEVFKIRNGIKEEDVASVKAWGKNNSGQGFSVVFKEGSGEESDVETVMKRVLEGIKPMTLPKLPATIGRKCMNLYTSDKHIGAEVSDSMYTNEYNSTVFRKRMDKISTELLLLCHKLGPLDTLIITDLGDISDGFNKQTTRGGHMLPQNLNNKEQFETAAKVHIEFYEKIILSGAAASYEIYHITNCNHSGDVGYMISRFIQLYFELKYPEVKFELLTHFINHVNIGKHSFLLTHGKDLEDRKSGLPLYINQDTENYLLQYVDKMKLNDNFISCIKGDLHKEGVTPGRKIRYKNVGSVFGASKWIHNNFGDSTPQCSVDVYEAGKREIWHIPIYLE